MPARAVLALAVLALAPGCFWFTTKNEGKTLARRVDEIDARVSGREEVLDQKIAKLDEAIARAAKLLTTTGADLGTDVEALEKSQADLLGQVNDLKRQVETLKAKNAELEMENAELKAAYDQKLAEYEQRILALEAKAMGKGGGPAVGTGEPDKDALYKRAQASLDAGQLTDARKDFKDFVKKYPADPRADDAQLALGEIYMREKTYDKALGEFQKVIDGWPDGDIVDKALFRAGEAAMQLKWCVDARAYFGLLVQKHPRSSLAKDAQKKLDFLKKNAKKKDVCQA